MPGRSGPWYPSARGRSVTTKGRALATIRVVIADDDPNVVDGLEGIFEAQAGIEVVARAQDAIGAVSAAQRLQPDVVVLDDRMPGLDACEATRQIKALNPRTRVIFFTTYVDGMARALAAGASSFLTKDCRPADLLRVIRSGQA